VKTSRSWAKKIKSRHIY